MNETIKNSADTSHNFCVTWPWNFLSLSLRERGGGVNKIDDSIIDKLRVVTVTSQYEYNQQDYKSLE